MTAKSGKKSAKDGASKKKKKNKPSLGKRILKFCLISVLILGLLGCASVAFVFWYYSRTLPQIFSYSDYQPKQMTVIMDRNHRPLLELFDEKRTVIPFDDIPLHMKNAMIASEDADFYKHGGLDYFGILRAFLLALKNGKFSQGASTITQQVVKNLLLTPEKNISRKIQEALLARQIENALTKDEILAIYLNHVYFGHGNYGVEQAALFFFGVHAKDMNINQAATIAGLVQSPERLSPKKHPDKALARQSAHRTESVRQGIHRRRPLFY